MSNLDNDNEEQILEIERKLTHLEEEVDNLTKWVRDGNGRPSLMMRIAKCENSNNNIEGDIVELEALSRQLRASVLSATISVIPALLALILTLGSLSNGIFSSEPKPTESQKTTPLPKSE